MNTCTFELNIGGIITSYTSEEALNDALLKEVFSDKDNEAPYFASSVFVNGSDNKDIVIHNNFFI